MGRSVQTFGKLFALLVFFALSVSGQSIVLTSIPAAVQGEPSNRNDVYPSLYKNSQGKLFLIYEQGIVGNITVPMWVMMKTSTDNGTTWTSYTSTVVSQLLVTNIGSGYTSTPSCAISGGGGSGATCTASAPVNGAIPSISLTNAGTGYGLCCAAGNTCTISGGGGSGAKCLVHADINNGNVISSIVLTSYGSGYTSTPTCTISGSGTSSGATCTVGAPVNGAITSYTLTARGSGFSSAPTLAVTGGGGSGAAATPTLNYCQPADPAGCLFHRYDNSDVGVGAGFSSAGTFVVFITDEQSDVSASSGSQGIYVMRSTDNGATWSVPTTVTGAGFQTTDFYSGGGQVWDIPSGSPGVTGSCSTGCLIKSLAVGPAGIANPGDYILFSYDDGVTWTDGKKIRTSDGYYDENALEWIGGNKLINFIRPSRINPASGGPLPLPFVYSSDLGTTWTSTCGADPLLNANACTGQPNALTPVQPTCPGGYTYTQDEFTWPSSFVQSVGKTTLLFGERFGCTNGSIFISRHWLRSVTFDNSAVFSTQIFPAVQYLYDVDLVALGAGNKTYGAMVPLSGNNLLIVFENPLAALCGNQNCEQIWQMTASYGGGSTTSPGLKLTSGIVIQ